MATYASLNAQQKADLATYDTFLRGTFSSLASLAKESDSMVWNQFAVANVDPVLATVDAAEVIPKSTGLAGAKDLTQAEFLQIQAIARQLTALLATNLPLIVKAVGINA